MVSVCHVLKLEFGTTVEKTCEYIYYLVESPNIFIILLRVTLAIDLSFAPTFWKGSRNLHMIFSHSVNDI